MSRSVNTVQANRLGTGLPLGFVNTLPTSELYRAYLWGSINLDRLAISGQMAFSNVMRELERRGIPLVLKPVTTTSTSK